MLLTICLLLSYPASDSLGIYSGRERQLNVQLPRFDAEVLIDGDLLPNPLYADALKSDV